MSIFLIIPGISSGVIKPVKITLSCRLLASTNLLRSYSNSPLPTINNLVFGFLFDIVLKTFKIYLCPLSGDKRAILPIMI